MIAMKLSFWFSILVGFFIFAGAVSGQVSSYFAALGVFFIVLGLLGFNSLRVAKLEEAIKEIKKGK